MGSGHDGIGFEWVMKRVSGHGCFCVVVVALLDIRSLSPELSSLSRNDRDLQLSMAGDPQLNYCYPDPVFGKNAEPEV